MRPQRPPPILQFEWKSAVKWLRRWSTCAFAAMAALAEGVQISSEARAATGWWVLWT